MNIELNLIISVFCVAFILLVIHWIFRKKINEPWHLTIDILVLLLLLIGSFYVIHYLFCYQIGFPAMVNQNNDVLYLGASDWLSFFGGYLGFSGSLVMAYLVYRQSEIINKYTIAEHKLSAGLLIQKCVDECEYKEVVQEYRSFSEKDVLFLFPPDLDKVNGASVEESSKIKAIKSAPQYYTVHLTQDGKLAVDCGDGYSDVLVFVEVVNHSKDCINSIVINNVVLTYGDKDKQDMKFYRVESLDELGKQTEIMPESRIRRCFLIHQMPKEFELGYLTFNFSIGKNSCVVKSLVSKMDGVGVLFLEEMMKMRIVK